MNNHIIIGTAGHVDHGKTCLIRALTGTDTDRLEEEKRRGITIDLGFTYLPLPDGRLAGIIDVPGHERFVHNMLSGAGGIDLALLVVAADEGVMPQTREHMGILSLLGITRGIIAVTKTDMVEDDWLELMLEELKEELQDSFLKNAPIIPVSSQTGAGIEELKTQLIALIEETPSKNIDKPFRLPVDRVFTMPGFGTVVTGTLIEGRLKEGQEVTIYPGGVMTRVRNLQVHAHAVSEAFAGQRVAVNLQRVKTEELTRGCVLAEPGSMQPTYMIDASVRLLPEARFSMRTGSRLHFHHGSGEMLCKAVLLGGAAELMPGQSAYAQLRFDTPVAVKAQDAFVLRFYSPLETVGGGFVLDPTPYKHKASSEKALEKLQLMDAGSEMDRVEALLMAHSPHYEQTHVFAAQAGLTEEQTAVILQELIAKGRAVAVNARLVLHQSHVSALEDRLCKLLGSYHQENPLKAGMRGEEIRGKLLKQVDAGTVDQLLDVLVKRGSLKKVNTSYALPDFEVRLTPGQQSAMDLLLSQLSQAGFAPPEKSALLAEHAKNRDVPKVLDYLMDTMRLIPVNSEIALLKEHHQKAQSLFEEILAEKDEVTLADFRDAISASRKYALALLEYWDLKGYTKKGAEARLLAKPFDPLD
ncbi:MAG: selenocysteine-specific translation elongation factor [Clostridiales bacterium]|nr:selenocysteine-specific translation elongation factor [Clostridiales bacterium]